MRIILDVDCILADTLPYWLDRIAQDTGVRASPEAIDAWDMLSCGPLAALSREQVYGYLGVPGFFAAVPPMPGAPLAVETLLREGHDIYLATARSRGAAVDDTRAWMQNWFPGLGSKVVFTDHKYLLKADLFIDDKLETLQQYRQYWGRTPTLATIEYAYNRGYESSNVVGFPYAASSWPQIVDFVMSLDKLVSV